MSNKNRLKVNDLKALRDFVEKLHCGKAAPLTSKEIDFISSYLNTQGELYGIADILWAAAEKSESTGDLVNKAYKALDYHAGHIDGRILAPPLRYLLKKLGKSEREKIISKYSRSAENELRMVVAEFIAEHLDQVRGLRLMLEILPKLGTDHDTRDSIAMWLHEKGTKDLKNALIMEAAQAVTEQDAERRDLLVWAASFM